MPALSGALASLAAPLLMTVGLAVWDLHWRGSAFALNMFKGSLATVGFLLLSVVTRLGPDSDPISGARFTGEVVVPLVLSSFLGILVGDFAWLEALRLIGARRVILVDALKPFLSAVLGWAVLGEELNWWAVAGIAVTAGGVTAVSLEKTVAEGGGSESEEESEEESEAVEREEELEAAAAIKIRVGGSSGSPQVSSARASGRGGAGLGYSGLGYFWAAINVVFDCFASVLTKRHGEGLNAWEIGLVRFGSASAAMVLISGLMALREKWKEKPLSSSSSSNSSKASPAARPWYKLPSMSLPSYLHVSFGVFLVTFACSALRNYALFEIPLAAALTLGAVGPIYALPVVWLVKGEEVTGRAAGFTVLAVCGVAILCLFGTSSPE